MSTPMSEPITRRLIQVFLSQSQTPGPGIFEVCADYEDVERLDCTCPGFKSRKTCKHTSFVQARIDSNSGTYPLEISSRATPEDALKARESNEAFRDFVIRFGKIEVC
ncbi:hypothetical protein UFOVP965_43 [uncultured Caudovirales phage]|uniref:SWIM-type domain-containing protein n=1 Tax=uncultured Caudovirales phage TaxID=2100421 RepID=A0A6J5PRA8_9CAUD|nr:hypothetical protein UFOVP965_43 [uncultured Caudovirales phage]CAB4179765.1 hypothetical protein UFOVP1035_39 [uncultured Caudovirales phage]CAB4188881.1 hypothetical protein UFOVP1181_145 [uncultured Caudovirales phage]